MHIAATRRFRSSSMIFPRRCPISANSTLSYRASRSTTFPTSASELCIAKFSTINHGGVFLNLEHVASATPRLHEGFLAQLDLTPETEDPSNKLLDLELQLSWLREIGFTDVDCHWKWRELALLAGTKPESGT